MVTQYSIVILTQYYNVLVIKWCLSKCIKLQS